MTEQSNLRGGVPPWRRRPSAPSAQITESLSCDILIVGAGITGSFVAEQLTQRGHRPVIIDRERPGLGSTAASTAMLQWELDLQLGELTNLYGFDRAAEIYRRSLAASVGLRDHVTSLAIGCAMRPRHTLYITGADSHARDLLNEYRLRARAGLPGDFLDHRTLRDEFDIDRAAAIVSPGSSDAEPVLLAQGLLQCARARGTKVFDAEAIAYHDEGASVAVEVDGGHVIAARQVVLATGYVMPDLVKSDLHSIAASWAIATPPQIPGALWRDGVLIWEASKDYLYARTTADNRIIIGGEDEDDGVDPVARDSHTPAKAAVLLKRLAALRPQAAASAQFAWSGAFGKTVDGLPLIGAVPGHPRIFAAYGYGGNGITFSFIAAQIIGQLVAGQSEPWFDHFAFARPRPGG